MVPLVTLNEWGWAKASGASGTVTAGTAERMGMSESQWYQLVPSVPLNEWG